MALHALSSFDHGDTMTIRWVKISNSAGQQLVANLNLLVRMEIADPTDGPATFVALQNGELKTVGSTRDSATIASLTALVQGAPDKWLPVEERDSRLPSSGWVNVSLVATATIAAGQVDLFAADGSWMGTATEPHAVMLAKNLLR